MDSADIIRRGAEAQRLTEEIQPYCARIEERAIEELVACRLGTEEGDVSATKAQALILALRQLQSLLAVEIQSGKQVAVSQGRDRP